MCLGLFVYRNGNYEFCCGLVMLHYYDVRDISLQYCDQYMYIWLACKMFLYSYIIHQEMPVVQMTLK